MSIEETNIKPLTPKVAVEYLQFKLSTENKDYLSYRNKLIPDYFSANEFCSMFNNLRKTMWKYNQEMIGEKDSHKEKESAFQYAMQTIIAPRMRNPSFQFGITKSLVGVLLNVFRDSTYQEYLNQVEARISDILERNIKDEQFSMIFQGLKDTYFFNQWLWNQTSDSEDREFFDQAWNVFESQEIKEMPEPEKNKLYRYLYEKYVK